MEGVNHPQSLALIRNFSVRYFVFEQAARLLGSEAETLDCVIIMQISILQFCRDSFTCLLIDKPKGCKINLSNLIISKEAV